MRAGRLRQRMVIEQDVGGNDNSLGGRTENWQAVLQVRLSAAYKGGREFERAQQIVAEISSLFVIRYDPRLAPLDKLASMRVRSLDDDSISYIKHADDPTRRRRQIHLYVKEGQTV